jgi:hypothetical protein
VKKRTGIPWADAAGVVEALGELDVWVHVSLLKWCQVVTWTPSINTSERQQLAPIPPRQRQDTTIARLASEAVAALDQVR